MRILYLATLFACLSLSACKKTNKFLISGISDISASRDTTILIPLNIEHEKGEQEKVTLSLSGAPHHVTYSFSSESGTPSFSTVLTIKVAPQATPGTYTLTIKADGSSGAREYTMNLKITEASSCRAALVGQYTGEKSGDCRGTANVTIDYDSTARNQVIIKNLFGKDETNTAIVNCSGNTFIIPSPSLKDANIESASFDGKTLYVKYSYVTGGPFPGNCINNLTKK